MSRILNSTETLEDDAYYLRLDTSEKIGSVSSEVDGGVQTYRSDKINGLHVYGVKALDDIR